MTFPGLRKLEKDYGFNNNGTVFYGFLKNCFVMFADGNNHKNVYIKLPVEPDEEDTQKLLGWKKKGYARTVTIIDEPEPRVSLSFAEYVVPYKTEKIREVIDDITKWFNDKYPEKKIHCAGKDCTSDTDLQIYNVDNEPIQLCPSCYEKIKDLQELEASAMKASPNNYFEGFGGALLWSFPGMILTVLLMWGGRLAGLCGVLHYYLAIKGYTWAKGKLNTIGVILTSIVGLFYSALGVVVFYFIDIFREMLKNANYQGYSFSELVQWDFIFLQEPEVVKEMMTNIRMMLFLCGIAIAFYAISNISSLRHKGIKKL